MRAGLLACPVRTSGCLMTSATRSTISMVVFAPLAPLSVKLLLIDYRARSTAYQCARGHHPSFQWIDLQAPGLRVATSPRLADSRQADLSPADPRHPTSRSTIPDARQSPTSSSCQKPPLLYPSLLPRGPSPTPTDSLLSKSRNRSFIISACSQRISSVRRRTNNQEAWPCLLRTRQQAQPS